MSEFTPSRTPSPSPTNPGNPGIYTPTTTNTPNTPSTSTSPYTDEEQASPGLISPSLSEASEADAEAGIFEADDEKSGLLPSGGDRKFELWDDGLPPHLRLQQYPHRNRNRNRRGGIAGRCSRRMLVLLGIVVAVALVILVGVMGVTEFAGWGHRYHRYHGHRHGHKVPCGASRHHSVTKPLPHPVFHSGPNHIRTKTITETFNPDSFTNPEAFNFYEEPSSNRRQKGYIKVVTDPRSSVVKVRYRARKQFWGDGVKFRGNGTGVFMSIDTGTTSGSNRRHHEKISGKVTVFLPKRIKHLNITTHSLPIRIKNNVNLHTLQVTSHRGNLKSQAKVRERTAINLHTGGISGTFDLGQELILETVLGSIRASIHPLDLKHAGAVANMVVKTFAGSIDLGLDCKDHDIPKRNYTSTVSTKTGRIQGTFLYGAELKIHTTTGSIDAKLTPTIYEKNEVGMLVTATNHGCTKLLFTRMLEGKWVEAYHAAVTGRIGVRYPGDWEGRITAETKVGKVQVSGDGVEITKDERGLVEAYKGDKQKGRIIAASGMGEVMVKIG